MSILSEKVLKEATFYLGPAAKTFLERQTKYHLDSLHFDDLKKEHLNDLCHWINISGGLVIGKDKAAELAEKVMNIR